MKIDIKVPNGITPRLDPKKKSDFVAQTANNVNLLRGRWDTINTPSTASPSDTWKQLALNPAYDVVECPVFDDQFKRYYYTGHSSGKLRMGGLIDDDNSDGVHDGDNDTDADDSNNDNTTAFERDAELPTPSRITSATATYILNPLSPAITCKWWSPGDGYVTCSYVGVTMTETGCILEYYFPGKVTTISKVCGIDNHKFYLTRNSVTIPSGSPACSKSITGGEKIPLIYGDTTYGELEVTSVSWGINGVYVAGTGVYTLSAGSVKFECDLHYKQGITRDVYYLMTYVNDLGMEGEPTLTDDEEETLASPSPMVTVKPGQAVSLASLSVSSNSTITKKRLYRSVAGTNEDVFMYLDEIANGTTTYYDVKADGELAEVIGEYGNPPDNMSGLVVHPGGFGVAFKGKDVYFSEPYLMHVWPPQYPLTCKSDIVGLSISGNDIIVMTKENPELITGVHPSQLSQSRIPLPQACSAKKSIATMGGSVFYASPDGLVKITASSVELITKGAFTREDWQTLTPSSMICASHDSKIFMFSTGGSYIFDFAEGLSGITTTDETGITALFSDVENDILYMTQSGTGKSWNTSSTAKQITWKSKEFLFPKPVTFNSGRVIADSYPTVNPIHFLVYTDNVLVANITVTSTNAFRLPFINPSRTWAIAVTSYVGIDEITISQSMEETMA